MFFSVVVCPLTTFLSLIFCCLKVYLKELLCDFSGKTLITVSDYLCVWIFQKDKEIARRQAVKEKKKKEREERLKESKQLDAEQEEDEEEEELPPIYIPDPPSPLYCGFYSQPDQFWLSMVHTHAHNLANIRSIQMFSLICILFSFILWSDFIQTTHDFFCLDSQK